MPSLQFAVHLVMSLALQGPDGKQSTGMMYIKKQTPLKKEKEVRGVIGYNCLLWQGNCELS